MDSRRGGNTMEDVLAKVSETTSYIASRVDAKPKIAIILGSGLGSLGDEVIEDRIEVPYSEIPNFPSSAVEGHRNMLIFGKIYGKDVVVMQGRFHYYEGLEMDEVAFPVRVFAFLGIEQLIVANAAGGINKNLKPQDLLLITDHINLSGNSPLRGPNEEMFGVRFPSMKNAYSPRLRELAKNVANFSEFDEELNKKALRMAQNDSDLKVDLKEGVYAFMPGPQYETDAEIEMLRRLGADAVGMSTVPEVIVAAHMGMEVLGLSCITNATSTEIPPSHDEVLENASKVEEKFKNFVMRIIMKM